MPSDTDKIDDAVLALPALTLHDDHRAWKGFDWDALDRLHAKGPIYDPVNKTKSVAFTEEGRARSRRVMRCSRRRSNRGPDAATAAAESCDALWRNRGRRCTALSSTSPHSCRLLAIAPSMNLSVSLTDQCVPRAQPRERSEPLWRSWPRTSTR
jgi:hypothetical protein